MSEINLAIQRISSDEQAWGPLYAELGRLLGDGSERVTLAFELAEARLTNRRLNLRAQGAESQVHRYEKAVGEWRVDEAHAYIPHASLLTLAKLAGLSDLGSPRHLKHFERVEQAEEVIERALQALEELKAIGATGRQYYESIAAALAVKLEGETNATLKAVEVGLPPFSGDQSVCPKCSYGEARVQYRTHGERPEQGIHSMSDVWPERLERECKRCDYTWDEDLNPPA